jgi:hypothetical protein
VSCGVLCATRMMALRERVLAATSAADGLMRSSAFSRMTWGACKRRASVVLLAGMAGNELLDDPVFEGMEADHDQQAQRLQYIRQAGSALLQGFKLGVDENPKSLKCARCRVLARLAGFDRVSHELGQFGGG